MDENRSKREEGEGDEIEEDEDEEEEEDIDFNPFLKISTSREGSPSLSSDIEELDVNSSMRIEEVEKFSAGGDESLKGISELRSQLEVENCCNQDIVSNKPIINVEADEDAICKRTRARYSLASFTLDELETFLQETDDEDDLQNVDDEEEYRKFLAAVLNGVDGEDQQTIEKENIDDEDEDNDADFEIELEELLESDGDEPIRDKDQELGYARNRHRPETRQNRRQKASAEYDKKLLEQSKRPLRPLLPIMPSGMVVTCPTNHGTSIPQIAPSLLPSTAQGSCLINGFTLQQIGQLHCLIHEHVQLLIQVFSLCIVDPSRQHIASQVETLIVDMLNKCNEVKSCKSDRYPDICFHPPNVCASAVDEQPNLTPVQCNNELSSTMSPHILNSASTCCTSPSDIRSKSAPNGMGPLISSSSWVPFVNGSVVSILDVAPLNLVRRYIDDVYSAISEHRRQQIDSGCDTWYEREPLFPYVTPLVETSGEIQTGESFAAVNTVALGQQFPKKSLAATIVERVKKQPIALVPKEIGRLTQRFCPLFNPALFPHKPPPGSVADRVLFTDSEDELLALGIMEYNTDWEAIKRRFLPCKSKHQIFIRQKNRCSSKQPENPIKAVRRVKNSPLSVEEVECIHEALEVFKHDWMSVWKFAVPHRDPSLLPRQWRTARGIQKSYKVDPAKREKRRLYEANRRRSKAACSGNWQQVSDEEAHLASNIAGGNNAGDNHAANADESYVHQAFLADWRPGAPTINSSDYNVDALTGEGLRNDNGSHPLHPQIDRMHGFPFASYHSPHVRQFPSSMRPPNNHNSNARSNISKSQIYLRPYRTRRTKGGHLVKLAPELPPLNLPSSVRIISQSAFKSQQYGPLMKPSTTGVAAGNPIKSNVNPRPPHVASKDTTLVEIRKNANLVTENTPTSCPEESSGIRDKRLIDGRSTDSDLRLHPLLFKAPTDGHLPYYALSSSNGVSNPFSFFNGSQPQLYLSLLHNPQNVNNEIDCFNRSSKTVEDSSASHGFGFHPLLQRIDEENGVSVPGRSNIQTYACAGGNSGQCQNPFGAVQRPSANGGPKCCSPNEKASELDLEMHLSSTSTKEKARKTRDLNDQSTGDTGKSHKNSIPSNQPYENICGNQCNLASVADLLPVPTADVSRCNLDDAGDQSLPEIVMEQEELSDSDEEDIGEHVEFECEEMDDSDGEEVSVCEVINDYEVQDYEVASFPTEKNTICGDSDDQRRKPVGADPPEGKNCAPKIFGPSLKLGLMSSDRVGTKTSWLTLDSCAPVDSPGMNAKLEDSAVSGGPTAAVLTPHHQNRPCKKTSSVNEVATQKDAMDMVQQLSLGPLDVSTLRRPRKRVCRKSTNSGAESDNRELQR